MLMMDVDFGEMCSAAVDQGVGRLDFQAYLHRRNGSGNDERTGAIECTTKTHVDASLSKLKLRLWNTDHIGVFVIEAPRSNFAVVCKICFLRPVFELRKFPCSLRHMD